MEKIEIHSDQNKCYLCRRSYESKRIHWIDGENGLKLVDLITHCPRCRNLCKRKKALEKKIIDIDWEIYGLAHTDYFDN